MARDTQWRNKELSYKQVVEKYPDVSPLVILKIDVQRRGVVYTEAAKAKIDPELHQVQVGSTQGFRVNQDYLPEGLILKDGSYLIVSYDYDVENQKREPYVIDVIDDKIYITDEGETIEEVTYWEKPDFYDKKASNGLEFSRYLSCRPQRLDIFLSQYCHFWDRPGEGCKYCPITPNFKKMGLKEERTNVKYIGEAVKEALKQEGRYSSFMISGGSVISGKKVFDDELDMYIELLQVIGENFEGRFPSQLICSAFNERQLERLYNETGLMTYTTDIEVLNEELFSWICAGKAHFIGYKEWKRRLIAAVDVFGRGNVTSGMVSGVELAQPNGFKTEDEAFNAITEEAESVISHGIALAANVWRAAPGSIFHSKDTPSLDYYVRLFRRFDELHHKYNVSSYNDDYRRCGMHVGLDLLRV